MQKKAPAKSAKKQVETSFGPRLRNPKPYTGSTMLLLGVMHLLATIHYRHDQEGLLPSIARQTSDFGDLNWMGTIGSDVAFLSLDSIGLIAWIPGMALVQWAWLLFWRSPKQVTLVHLLRVVLLLSAGTSLLAYLQHQLIPHLSAHFPQDYLPSGPGGLTGSLLYETYLQSTLGPVGTGILLGALTLFALYFTFHNLFNGVWRVLTATIRWMTGHLPKLPERKKRKLRMVRERPPETIPEILPARRGILSLLFGKSIVESDPADTYQPDIPCESSNQPNLRYLEKLGKPLPKPPPKASQSRLVFDDETPESSTQETRRPEPARTESPNRVAKIKIVASEKTEKDKLQAPQKRGKYKFPTIDLLEASTDLDPDQSTDHQAVADRLKSTLEDFKIKVELGEVHIGPVITRYDLHPAPGVRVEKISALERNLTMALQAQSVRILAPVPGKGCVGIEIPNTVPQSVRVRDILETKIWTSSKAEIPIVLGKDVSGRPLVTDLTRMPHLLIAGSTGSGKTVCINALICSLLYHSSPEDLRFMMIDPKIVEMKVFNDLPHMLIPVVTDPKKVPNALKWLISEMENRYQIFAKVGVRNIAGFNAKILKNQESKALAKSMDADLTAEERAAVKLIEVERDDDALEIPEKKLPYIVCIIDELADLMMVAPADIETCIARLAQLARAAGIHLIIATQRPSVNVITGVIKANLPSRISFKVASKIDSRTILDGGGADGLIGRGDMLFIPPGAHHLIRAQGAFVSDDEISGIVDYLKINGPPAILESVQQQIERDPDDDGGPTTSADTEDWGDAMVPDAIEVIRSSGRASTSMLQRRLRIGYNRAARIMDILEERELVGPDNGSQPREILVDLNDI